MNNFLLIGIAFGLAMDSFAVGVAKGAEKNFRTIAAFKLAFAFAFAHVLMAFLGWLGGSSVSEFVGGVDHWVAFALLFAIGAKMIYGYFHNGLADKVGDGDVSLKTLLMLSIATSIDALIVGVSFAFLPVDILIALCIIATMIFAITLLGVFAGKNFYKLLGSKSEVFGGLVLIAIGVKTLIEHLEKLI